MISEPYKSCCLGLSLFWTIALGTHFLPEQDRLILKKEFILLKIRNISLPKTPPSSLDPEKEEIVLHVDGSGMTRVLRHTRGTTSPGRLTLTTNALYFETSGVMSYDKALRFDLSTDALHQLKPGSTGPWGAPIFDKAIIYQSTDLEEPMVLEFSELTGSTRRDYWLALIAEVISVHKFIRAFGLKESERAEAMGRSALGIFRLHATKETFQMMLPARPRALLTFSWLEELPRGDRVSQELANSIRRENQEDNNNIRGYICWASSLLGDPAVPIGESGPLEATVQRSAIEAKRTEIARESIEGLRAEGILNNAAILKELLLGPLMNLARWVRQLLSWEKPSATFSVLILSLIVIYMGWVVYAMCAWLALAAGFLFWIRQREDIKEKYDEIAVSAISEQQSTVESVVSAQQSLSRVNSAIQTANITLLKLLSIALSKPIKHTDQVILGLLGVALVLLIIPFKVIVMGVIVGLFTMNLRIWDSRSSGRFGRRMKEWWDGVPAVSVRL